MIQGMRQYMKDVHQGNMTVTTKYLSITVVSLRRIDVDQAGSSWIKLNADRSSFILPDLSYILMNKIDDNDTVFLEVQA